MKEFLKQAVIFLFAGAAIMAGMKTADHLIPDPERQLEICVIEPTSETMVCGPR